MWAGAVQGFLCKSVNRPAYLLSQAKFSISFVIHKPMNKEFKIHLIKRCTVNSLNKISSY